MLGVYFLQAIAVGFVLGVAAGICYLLSRVWLAIFGEADVSDAASEVPASDEDWRISFHHSDGSVLRGKTTDSTNVYVWEPPLKSSAQR